MPKVPKSALSPRKFLKDAGLIAGGAWMASVSPITAEFRRDGHTTDTVQRETATTGIKK